MFIPIYIFLFGTGATYWLPNGIEAKHIITNLTLTHSFWPDTIGGIVHGGWSISVEAMFYLLFPLLAVVALHRSAAFSAALAALSFSIISFAYQPIFELYSQSYPNLSADLVDDFLYLNVANQMFVFLTGIALYQARETPILYRAMLSAFPIFCALPMFFLGFITTKSFGFSVVVFFLSGIFIVVSYLTKELKRSYWPIECLRAFGQRSYGMYIIHFLAIAAFSKLPLPNQVSAFVWPLAFALTVATSYYAAKNLEVALAEVIEPIKSRLLGAGFVYRT